MEEAEEDDSEEEAIPIGEGSSVAQPKRRKTSSQRQQIGPNVGAMLPLQGGTWMPSQPGTWMAPQGGVWMPPQGGTWMLARGGGWVRATSSQFMQPQPLAATPLSLESAERAQR
jgi:hypothetical protein